MNSGRSIVLYAVGSSLLVDVEETCRRLRVTIAAAIRNVAGAQWLCDTTVLREAVDIDAGLLAIPCLVPLFNPFNRHQATREAVGRGFSIAPPLVDPSAVVASSTTIGSGAYVNAGVVIGAAGCADRRWRDYFAKDRDWRWMHHRGRCGCHQECSRRIAKCRQSGKACSRRFAIARW